jgi:TetR/AcrR family transcriptional regulator, transcriptional repressor for nem operon
MRYDTEHKARTRERVLKEAALALREHGPDRLGVAEVMKRAGLTHGGFYAHFSSREALLAAAVEEMFAGVRGMFDRRTADMAPCEALQAYVRFYLSRSHRDARDQGCPLPVLSGDLPRMGAAGREHFAEGVARLTGVIAAKLEATGRPDAEAVAGSVLMEMIGAVSVARAMGPTPQSDALLANARTAVLARLGVGDDA